MVTPLANLFGEAVKAISHLGVAQRMEEDQASEKRSHRQLQSLLELWEANHPLSTLLQFTTSLSRSRPRFSLAPKRLGFGNL